MPSPFTFVVTIFLVLSTQVCASQNSGNPSNQDATGDHFVQVDKVRIRQLEIQLSNGIKIGQAVHDLISMLDESQSAMQPLIRFYKRKAARSRTEERALRKTFQRMQSFFKEHRATQESIHNLIDTINYLVENRTVWSHKIPEIMVLISNNIILSGDQVDQLGKIARRDQELRGYSLYINNPAVTLLKAIAIQGRSQKLNKDISDLAKRSLESRDDAVIKIGLSVLASQSRFNDSENIAAINNITTNPPSGRIAYKLIKDKIRDLENKPNADKEIAELIDNYKSNQKYSSVTPGMFKKLLNNPYIKSETRAKLYVLTSDNKQAGNDYLVLLKIKQRAMKSHVDNEQFIFLLDCINNYVGHDIYRQAMILLVEVKDKYGLSAVQHHKLIEYFARVPEKYRLKDYGELVSNSIPFAYGKVNAEEKYDSKLIETVISNISGNKNYKNVILFQILNKISRYQVFSRENIDKVYPYTITFAKDAPYLKFVSDIILEQYNKTGYANRRIIDQVISSENLHSYELSKILISVIKQDKQHDTKKELLNYYVNGNINEKVRLNALSELMRMDFEYAQGNTLPPFAYETKEFKSKVWSMFSGYSRTHNVLMDKDILLDATNEPDTYIQHLAWEQLKHHGVSIPLHKRIQHPHYGAKLKFDALSVFALVSIVIAYFLYTGGIKKHDSKAWGIAQVSSWILASLIFIGLDIVNILLHGLSHSGYPYRSASNILILTNAIYLGLGIIMRMMTIFVARKSISGELKGEELLDNSSSAIKPR